MATWIFRKGWFPVSYRIWICATSHIPFPRWELSSLLGKHLLSASSSSMGETHSFFLWLAFTHRRWVSGLVLTPDLEEAPHVSICSLTFLPATKRWAYSWIATFPSSASQNEHTGNRTKQSPVSQSLEQTRLVPTQSLEPSQDDPRLDQPKPPDLLTHSKESVLCLYASQTAVASYSTKCDWLTICFFISILFFSC